MISLLWGCYAPQDAAIESREYSIKTDAEGYAELKLRIPDNVSSFVATAQSPVAIYADALISPEKEALYEAEKWQAGAQNLSNAVWPYFTDSTLQWPIRSIDSELFQGKWKIRWHAPDLSREQINVQVMTATDTDWSSGELDVSICYAPNLLGETEALSAVQEGVEQFVALYADQGITVFERDCEGDVPDDLSLLAPVDSVKTIRSQLPPETMLVIVGDWIDMDPTRLGFSGSIPGPISAHPRAYIGVSWLAHAGADGAFNAQDIRILGETIAHETGHYLGLFHPVELDLSATDALEDTPECDDLNECTSIYQNHLMHAAPVCALVSCAPQFEVSTDQFDVLQRHTAVY